ncbi:hypothetical protein CEXT_729121 [Caerostris extrusa]|uniref:Uncharacterized protein n=1 Tax=Caerostris extrusa TaxID=172846 RepID=A0AAV4PJ58_CAEEX|nr:hypothetical protein CEXT_729121 [Caerostris extrusa]
MEEYNPIYNNMHAVDCSMHIDEHQSWLSQVVFTFDSGELSPSADLVSRTSQVGHANGYQVVIVNDAAYKWRGRSSDGRALA